MSRRRRRVLSLLHLGLVITTLCVSFAGSLLLWRDPWSRAGYVLSDMASALVWPMLASMAALQVWMFVYLIANRRRFDGARGMLVPWLATLLCLPTMGATACAWLAFGRLEAGGEHGGGVGGGVAGPRGL